MEIKLRLTTKFALMLLVCVILAGGYDLVQADPLDVIVTVSTDKSAYGRGETVVITVSVKNNGSSTLNFVFATTHQAGCEIYQVRAHRGKCVYTTYDDYYLPVVTYLTLEPGETKNYTRYWSQVSETDVKIKPGNYWVFGYFVEPFPGTWSQPRVFEIRGYGYGEN